MDRKTIEEKIIKIIVEDIPLDVEDWKFLRGASLSSHLRDDLNVEPLDEVELVVAIEERFGIRIPDELAESVITVADMVDVVEKILNQPEADENA